MHQHVPTRQATLCYKSNPEHRIFDSSGTLRWLQHPRQRPSPRTSESFRRHVPPRPCAPAVDYESCFSDDDEQRAGALFAAVSTEATNDSSRRSPSSTRRSPSPTSRSPSPDGSRGVFEDVHADWYLDGYGEGAYDAGYEQF